MRDAGETQPQCLFCGRSQPEIKMSREHVLRSWFRERMEPAVDARETTKHEQLYVDESGKWADGSRTMPQSPWDVVVKKVCKPCNEGWMNRQVEIPVQWTLLDLMKAQPTQLIADDLRLVATWAAKTAVTRAATDRGAKVIPFEHASHIREHLEPPPGTRIWMAQVEPPPNTWTRHLRFTDTPHDDGPGAPGHLTTVIAGALMLHVAGGADDNLAGRIQSVRWPASVERSGAMTEVWPEPKPRTWPGPELRRELAMKLSSHISRSLGYQSPFDAGKEDGTY